MSQPHTAAYHYAAVIERTARGALAQLAGLSDDTLNRSAPIPEANTLYALATHLAGAGEYWSITLLGDRAPNRDRAAEFHATGSLTDLTTRFERWLADLHAVLDSLPNEALDRPIETPISPGWQPADEPLTVRDCLLHAVEHSALHLGHIQLTTQLFRNGVW
ncbi:MAG TPA: DinB family protein [Ktedonobacterales bacterium]|nr:DinB family protein [Ktedonobacterales bacterium]